MFVTPKSTTRASLSWSGVTARRMARHALTEAATNLGPADIAGMMCGVHAQILSGAELSTGRRIIGESPTPQDKTAGPGATAPRTSSMRLRALWLLLDFRSSEQSSQRTRLSSSLPKSWLSGGSFLSR